jgi:hypothetical protein
MAFQKLSYASGSVGRHRCKTFDPLWLVPKTTKARRTGVIDHGNGLFLGCFSLYFLDLPFDFESFLRKITIARREQESV